jgi:Extensin-like protein C-terminus
MSRRVFWSLFGSLTVATLMALAGCSHYWVGERETWRHDAEVDCINSGAVKDTPERVRISAINGPGMCGMDFPLRVSALGASGPLGYDDEPPLRPPLAIPESALPPRWPVQSSPLPPPHMPQASTALPIATPASPTGAPLSLTPPGVPSIEAEDDELPRYSPRPYYGAQPYPSSPPPTSPYPPRGEHRVPLGPERAPMVTGAVGPVEVKPVATLACPLVSALDQWISSAVQPAALRWFRQPVVEIKQISAYSCRGMNGNPYAHISEHAFGNALDIAEFTLADGRKISVQYGWRGTPEEQGFLHDVQSAACQDFTTVLAPGANVYHYNHIHVDLMRRSAGRHVCEPTAIPGEFVAARARAQYAARHGDTGITGSIKSSGRKGALNYSGEDDNSLPLAAPGED